MAGQALCLANPLDLAYNRSKSFGPIAAWDRNLKLAQSGKMDIILCRGWCYCFNFFVQTKAKTERIPQSFDQKH